MQLDTYVAGLREQMATSASAGGEEVLSLAQRLTAALESAARLTLLEALSAAAAEITRELAPGSVEVRLRGSEPEFVVTSPAAGPVEDSTEARVPTAGWASSATGEGGTARINLRLPDQLKTRVEQHAEREGLSINTWLVRAIGAAVDRGPAGPSPRQRTARAGQRYTGWAQ